MSPIRGIVIRPRRRGISIISRIQVCCSGTVVGVPVISCYSRHCMGAAWHIDMKIARGWGSRGSWLGVAILYSRTDILIRSRGSIVPVSVIFRQGQHHRGTARFACMILLLCCYCDTVLLEPSKCILLLIFMHSPVFFHESHLQFDYECQTVTYLEQFSTAQVTGHTFLTYAEEVKQLLKYMPAF